MEHRNLQAAKDVLTAIHGMVSDTLECPHVRRHIGNITKLDLAYDFRRMRHAEICHYLRCEASRDVLVIIGDAVQQMLDRLAKDEPHTKTALEIVEPYRHHIYSSVIVVSLVAADREETQREQEYWRNRNAMKIVPTEHEFAVV